MDCPTCFQQITVPQAPASGSQKFIITGSKAPKSTAFAAAAPSAPVIRPVVPVKRFPGASVVVLILVFIGTAAAAIYWATIIHPRRVAPPVAPPETQNASLPESPSPEPPSPVTDADWKLDLDASPIPDVAAAGRLHGRNFTVERAAFQNGVLTLRQGTHGAMELGAIINFNGIQADALAGKTINITTNALKAARVSLRWKDGDAVQKADYDAGYAMRLEFGTLERNRLPVKIHLCLPDDEKSYLRGSCTANISAGKPKK